MDILADEFLDSDIQVAEVSGSDIRVVEFLDSDTQAVESLGSDILGAEVSDSDTQAAENLDSDTPVVAQMGDAVLLAAEAPGSDNQVVEIRVE